MRLIVLALGWESDEVSSCTAGGYEGHGRLRSRSALSSPPLGLFFAQMISREWKGGAYLAMLDLEWMMRKSPGISEKGRFHPLFGMANSRGPETNIQV
ncbi:hypothetical protein BKA83DRAFT_678261 [Pisolithus microcarpus]|nr:hypothetical protein BKA83DRAFT_678261 [Pisolithus microcarpus]